VTRVLKGRDEKQSAAKPTTKKMTDGLQIKEDIVSAMHGNADHIKSIGRVHNSRNEISYILTLENTMKLLIQQHDFFTEC
jgi:hypothetical protein